VEDGRVRKDGGRRLLAAVLCPKALQPCQARAQAVGADHVVAPHPTLIASASPIEGVARAWENSVEGSGDDAEREGDEGARPR
jgi:hypothetical protein